MPHSYAPGRVASARLSLRQARSGIRMITDACLSRGRESEMRRLTTSSLTDALKRKTQSFRCLVVFGLLITPILLTALPARAQLISQMVHTAWTSQNGAPQAVTALAEGHDGVLWIGSQSGLYSFDGATFRAFQSPAGQPAVPSGAIDSLLVAKNGDLWVGMFLEGIVHISDGRVRIYKSAAGLAIRLHSAGARWNNLVHQRPTATPI